MISDNIAKLTFINNALADGFKQINEAQIDIASERLYCVGSSKKKTQGHGEVKSDKFIETYLRGQQASIMHNGASFIMSSKVLTRIRFLDMKKYGNYQIYNRQLYGILYNETMPRIKFQFYDQVQNQMQNLQQEIKLQDQLSNAINSK